MYAPITQHTAWCLNNAVQSAFENGAEDHAQATEWAHQYLDEGMSACRDDVYGTQDCAALVTA